MPLPELPPPTPAESAHLTALKAWRHHRSEGITSLPHPARPSGYITTSPDELTQCYANEILLLRELLMDLVSALPKAGHTYLNLLNDQDFLDALKAISTHVASRQGLFLLPFA